MSYYKAKECFQDNLNVIRKPQTDQEVFIWNLSTGLQLLVQAIESDFSQFDHKLDQIFQALQHLK